MAGERLPDKLEEIALDDAGGGCARILSPAGEAFIGFDKFLHVGDGLVMLYEKVARNKSHFHLVKVADVHIAQQLAAHFLDATVTYTMAPLPEEMSKGS